MDWEGLGFTEVTASGTGAAAASGASWVVPVIGAAVSGVTMAIQLWLNRKRPKQKVWTSRIADEVSALMVDNLNAWYRSNKTRSEQRQALSNFDLLWEEFVRQTAGNPDMGEPGKRAVSERERGGRYDWFAMFRDPIANDPEVQDDYMVRVDTGDEVKRVESWFDSLGFFGLLGLGLIGYALIRGYGK